jgi:hypothetical protein
VSESTAKHFADLTQSSPTRLLDIGGHAALGRGQFRVGRRTVCDQRPLRRAFTAETASL